MTNATQSNGISGANFDIYGANRTLPRAMTAFTAISWYNSIEILVIVFCIFKKYSGLYFWSLIINALSIVPYATGMLSANSDYQDETRWTDWMSCNRSLDEAE